MGDIDILGSKNETQTPYLKNYLEVFFLGYSDIFDSDLKKFFENIASEEKNIDYKLLSREVRTPSKKTFSFFQKHRNLYDFLTNVLKNTSLNTVKLLQVELLDHLINGFNDLYSYLFENPKRTVYDLFLNTSTDQYNKQIYLQAQKLFSLREDIFKI